MASGKKISRKNQNRAAFFVLGIVSLFGCEGSRDSICGELPAVVAEIDGIQVQIAALGKPNRKIASIAAADPEEILERREAWMAWGERALKRAQWAKDALENDSRGRKAVPALNEAGMSLVSFHGFLEQRKWRKAGAELERAEANLERARKVACGAEAPSKRGK